MRGLVIAFALIAGLSAAQAAPYPSRVVKLIVPIAPGGPVDTIARAMAPALSTRLKQTFIVENRPGAGGNVGIQTAAAAEPDGYTLLLATGSMVTVNPLLYRKPPFDPLVDLRPISTLTASSQTLVVHPSFPATSLSELVAFAKREPFTYATSGYGSPSHLAMEYLRLLAGFSAEPVSYRGLSPLMSDLLGGQIGVGFVATSGVIDHLQQGRLRAIGISSSRRSRVVMDVPTIAESGYPKFDVDSYIVMLAPSRVPDPVATLLEREVRQVVVSAEFQEKYTPQDLVGVGNSSAEAKAWIAQEMARWAKVVKAANMQMD